MPRGREGVCGEFFFGGGLTFFRGRNSHQAKTQCRFAVQRQVWPRRAGKGAGAGWGLDAVGKGGMGEEHESLFLVAAPGLSCGEGREWQRVPTRGRERQRGKCSMKMRKVARGRQEMQVFFRPFLHVQNIF